MGQPGHGAAVPGAAGHPDRAADGSRLHRHSRLAWRAAVLHAPPGRPGARGAADRRPGRAGTRAHRPGGPRSVRPDHAGCVAAGQGGAPAGLPVVRRRRRGVGAAGDGRGLRGRRGRPDHPLPVLPGRVAARRGGVLLRAQAPAGPGPRRGGAVPPPGLPACRRRPGHRGRGDLRRGPGQDGLLRRLGQPGRPLAGDLRGPGHGAAQRPVAGRPHRVRRGPAGPAGGPGGRGRPDQPAPGPGRPAVRVHRFGRAAGQAGGHRPGAARPAALA